MLRDVSCRHLWDCVMGHGSHGGVGCGGGLPTYRSSLLALSRHGVDTTFSHNARCIQHVSKLNAQSKQVIA
jgi:hypothetical protein